MDETSRLAQFACELRYEDLPAEVICKTKSLILDQLGAQLWASNKPWGMLVYTYVTGLGGRRESTVVNYGDKIPAESAAMVNGTFGHGFEIDDTHWKGSAHPGCVIIPSALAMGERELINGRALILATTVGYEVMGRIGKAAPCQLRGFHPVSAVGPFGAASVAGKILGFGKETMLNALSIAGSHASGVMEYNQTGGMVERIHAGIAAQGGLRAAILAQKGLTGPPTILEGRNGFCNAFCDNPRLEQLTANLGREFVVMEIAYKLHACCASAHSALDAAAQIVAQHRISPDDVEEIALKVNSNALRTVGAITEPHDITAAQFSAPFSIGLNLVHGGNSVEDYTEESLKDSRVWNIVRRVKMQVEPAFDAEFPAKVIAEVQMTLKDGRTYRQRVDYAKGMPENSLSPEEVENKFRSLACKVLPDDRVDEIIRVIEDLETVAQVPVLCRLLVR